MKIAGENATVKNKYISKRYWKSHQTAMGQSDAMAKSFNDVINLSLGDPDLNTPSSIIQKAFEDANAGHTKYTDFRGDPELVMEICKFYKTEYDMSISPAEVFVTSSATVAMHLALEAILDDGDEVILQAPYFTPYPQQVLLSRGIPVELPTLECEDFQINVDRLESLITERTRALVINTPNNPTGSCLSLQTMQEIADVVRKHDLIVIADDIYTDYSYENPFKPFAKIEGMRERTITLNSFSKGFNMTGWRVGHIVAPAYITDVIQEINENVCFTTSSISQRAAIYALRHRKELQPPIVEEYHNRVNYAASRINKIPKMRVIEPPKGTFYLFPCIKETGLSSEEVADLILKEAHVALLPGSTFGTCGQGYLRIACTVGMEKLEEAFNRIEKMSIFCE